MLTNEMKEGRVTNNYAFLTWFNFDHGDLYFGLETSDGT